MISRDKHIGITLFSFSVILLFVLSFIRWETGTDWQNYYDMYSWIKSPFDNLEFGMEKGFSFVNHLGKFIFNSYTGVLFIFAIIIYISMAFAFPRLTSFPMTAIWLSFSVSFANMLFVRQNVALAILLVATVFAYRRKLIIFLLLVYTAALFHRTAYCYVLAYFLFKPVFNTRYIIISLIVAAVIGIGIAKLILGYMGTIGSVAIQQRIEMYVELGMEDNSTNYSSTAILIKGFLNRAVLCSIILYFINYHIRSKNILLNGLMNIYIFGTILYISLLPLSISLARVATYMDAIQVFLITTVIFFHKGVKNRLIIWGLFVLYFGIRYYTSLMGYKEYYIPFTTIFN